MKRILLLCIVMLGINIAYSATMDTENKQLDEKLNVISAKSIKFSLVNIAAKKVSERGGDELYLTVTTYPSAKRPTHERIPDFPKYWLSSYVDQIENLEVWRGSLQPEESVLVLFTLLEHDVPPWNTDDLIGVVRAKVYTEDGKIKVDWKMPNSDAIAKDVKTEKGMAKAFDLYGEDFHYALTLQMEESDSPS